MILYVYIVVHIRHSVDLNLTRTVMFNDTHGAKSIFGSLGTMAMSYTQGWLISVRIKPDDFVCFFSVQDKISILDKTGQKLIFLNYKTSIFDQNILF